MDIVTSRASNIHLKWVLAKEVSFLMNKPYEAYQTSIFSVSLFLSFSFSQTHTHTPLVSTADFPLQGASADGNFYLQWKSTLDKKRHSKGLFFPGCPKIDLVHRMPQIIAFGNFILLMIYFLYDQYDKCEGEQSGLRPDTGEVRRRERWAAALCVSWSRKAIQSD